MPRRTHVKLDRPIWLLERGMCVCVVYGGSCTAVSYAWYSPKMAPGDFKNIKTNANERPIGLGTSLCVIGFVLGVVEAYVRFRPKAGKW